MTPKFIFFSFKFPKGYSVADDTPVTIEGKRVGEVTCSWNDEEGLHVDMMVDAKVLEKEDFLKIPLRLQPPLDQIIFSFEIDDGKSDRS